MALNSSEQVNSSEKVFFLLRHTAFGLYSLPVAYKHHSSCDESGSAQYVDITTVSKQSVKFFINVEIMVLQLVIWNLAVGDSDAGREPVPHGAHGTAPQTPAIRLQAGVPLQL